MAGTVNLTGLTSNMDWSSMITAVINAEKAATVTPLQNSKTSYQSKLTAWQSFNTTLSALKNYIDTSKMQTVDGYKLYSTSLTSSDSSVTPSDILSATLGSPSGPGTYSIEVTALAQAEKAASDVQTSKTTVLGLAGDILINNHKISISADDTLTMVMNKINQAGAGVTASIISTTDTSHRLVLESSTTGTDVMSVKNGSNVDILGGLKIHTTGRQLAHALDSDAGSDTFKDNSTAIGTLLNVTSPQSGTVTIKGTSVSINLATDSLTTIAASINGAVGSGTATVDSVTQNGATAYRLRLSSASIGDLTDSNNVLETLGVVEGTNFSTLRSGANAALKVEGFAVTSTSNTITSVLDGVTLTLKGTNVGKAVDLAISQDSNALTSQVSSLVQDINSVFSFIKDQNTYTSSTSSSGTATQKPLFGDVNLTAVRDTIDATLFAEVSGNSVYKTASDIGIHFQKDGTISLDSSALTSALSTNREDVVNVLKALSNSLYDKMNMYVDPYTGTMTSIQTSITDQMSHIDDRIKDLNARYTKETDQLQQRYNALEVQMNSSTILKNWLTQQTAYMTGTNK